MKQTTLETYRSLMSGVELPDRVRENVAAEVAQAHENQEAAGTPDVRTPTFRANAKRRPLVRGIAAAACVATLALGLAFGSGIAHLPSTPPSNGADTAALPASGNSFALAAYAAELSVSDGQSVTLELRDFGYLGGWGCGDLDLETGEVHSDSDAPGCVGDDGQRFAQVRYLLDLSCTGTNIKSITYSIGGERVHFTSENWAYGSNSDEPVDFEQQDSFVIDYDDQEADKTDTQRNLAAYFPVNERGCKIQSALEEDHDKVLAILKNTPSEDGASVRIAREDHPELLSDAELQALNDELGDIILCGYADLLAQAPLTLTATFQDGSTQTKSYLITPVADFKERLNAYREKSSKPMSFLENLFAPAEKPALYTITETTG